MVTEADGSNRTPFRFGVQRADARTGAQWLESARQAEALGYDALLMPDHFGAQFAPFSGLAAAAAITSTLRVGTLVAANDFRHPLVLAKEAATLIRPVLSRLAGR